MGNFKFFKHISLALAAGLFTVSCSDDDDNSTPDPDPTEKKVSFIITSSDATLDLQGGNSTLILDSELLSTLKDTVIYDNPAALYTKDVFTQVSYNNESKVFTGYIYGRGAVELGGAGLRNYEIVDDKLQKLGEPVTVSNFGNTGIFGAYSYAAGISTGSIMVVSKTGSTVTGSEKLIDLTEYAIDGTSPSITGIADRGDNKVAIALYYANRDSAAVAFADYNMTVSSIEYDARIGASYGAWRSVRYDQIGTDDEGNVYVFSGAGKEMAGALKIAKGSDKFDSSYLFDILSASDGYRFRKVFRISEDYFLLEFYNEKDKYGNLDSSGKFAVVKMSDKSFKWVTGLPATDAINNIGWPEGYDGTIYLPIKPNSGKPTIYGIDAKTAVATPRLTVAESELLKSVAISVATVEK